MLEGAAEEIKYCRLASATNATISLIVIRIFCSKFKVTLSTLLLNHTRIDIQNPDSASVESERPMIWWLEWTKSLEKSLPSRARHVLMALALRLPHIDLRFRIARLLRTLNASFLRSGRSDSFNSPVLHPISPFEKQLQT